MKLNLKMNFKKVIISILAFAITLSCFSGACSAFVAPTYIVANGESEYKIVLAQEHGSVEKTASLELQKFFGEATGISLSIITDNEATQGGKYLSIGKTSLVTSEVTNALSGLTSNGYVVKTVGQTVYMLGPSVYGSLNATYAFLAEAFNYEFFFTDVYTLDTGVLNLELENYNIKVNPDINGMTDPNAGIITFNLENKNRYGVAPTDNYFISVNGTTETHNLWYILPQGWSTISEYEKWFSDSSKTACFTAHGDPDAYEAMVTHFAEVGIKGYKNSDATIYQIAQPDNCGFCECSTCNSVEGGSSAIVIQFCNDVAAKIGEWFDSTEGQAYYRDFTVIFLAYQSIAKAPTNKLKCADNVGIYLAFDYCQASFSLNTDKDSVSYSATNKGIYETIMAWKEVTDIFVFWLYNVDFNYYFYPYDTTDYQVDFFKLMKEVGVITFNVDAQYRNRYNTTAWCNVKSYLTTKLRWDVNLNVSETVRKYFDNCYKNAADIMYDIYCQQKAHWQILRYETAKNIIPGRADLQSVFGNLNNQKFWSRELLEGWVKQFKQAIEAIEPLKTSDIKGYNAAYKMIMGEMASPLAMLIEMYGTSYNSQDFDVLAKEFIKACTDGQIVYSGSKIGFIEEYYDAFDLLKYL